MAQFLAHARRGFNQTLLARTRLLSHYGTGVWAGLHHSLSQFDIQLPEACSHFRVVNGSKQYMPDTSKLYLPSYNFSVAKREQIRAQIRRLTFQITCPGGIRTRIELSGNLSCEAV
ncbi:hypothetical protein PHMEG_00021216 [Phytophthora megakarya]|uniref:Uncharacterized protein n=1 Tax=Phytophthora megakarya TaxID=4795 RepID=A0A225VNP2_9STRA|nr:hypothetical protein PHMEG_00021216 [Phytophthora megakarya]